MGVLLVIGGRLGDRFGQRRLFLVGIGGLTVDLAGCGGVLALVVHSGTAVSLWALAPVFFVIGLSFATIPTVALGDAKPDEADSASGLFGSIQQIASAIASATISSVFFGVEHAGSARAMEVTLIVVLAVTALSLPIVALMPRTAPAEPQE